MHINAPCGSVWKFGTAWINMALQWGTWWSRLIKQGTSIKEIGVYMGILCLNLNHLKPMPSVLSPPTVGSGKLTWPFWAVCSVSWDRWETAHRAGTGPRSIAMMVPEKATSAVLLLLKSLIQKFCNLCASLHLRPSCAQCWQWFYLYPVPKWIVSRFLSCWFLRWLT